MDKLKVLVTGSRNLEKMKPLNTAILAVTVKYGLPTEILHGGAKGADQLAAKWATIYKKPVTVIKPNYQKYGSKAAPLERNTELVHKADLIIALYGTGRNRKGGTWDTVQKGIKANKPVIEIMDDGKVKWTLPVLQLF